MIFEPEYYQILGIKSNATDGEIKQAYKKKAMELHPDKNRNDPKATEKFQQLGEAYETLKDPIKRKKYDSDNQPKKQENKRNEDIFSSNIYEELFRNLFGFKSRTTFNSNQSRGSRQFSRNFFFDDDDDDDSDESDDFFDDSDEFDEDSDDELNTIFIGGLPFSASEDDLFEAFDGYNPYRAKVVKKSFSQPPFGFVQFLSSSAMQKAVRANRNIIIDGKLCHAKVSHTNLYDNSSRKRRFY